MSKSNIKPKPNLKNRKLHFNKICRSCLSERGHLRELFSTRLPLMMESCATIQVSENDELPNKICVSCFHQIAKFYTFKKKLERNDKILRSYLKQKKLKETKEFSDILHKAVNDAEIISNDKSMKLDNQENADRSEDSSDEDIPLSERCLKDTRKETIRNSPRLLRKSKQKANKIIDTIIKNEEEEEDEFVDNPTPPSSITESEINYEEIKSEETHVPAVPANNFESVIFDGPPPLIPLAPSKLTNNSDTPQSSTLKNLPQNAPPLVPIKPLSSLNPATIVNALSDDIENPVKLKLQCNICNEEFNSVFALKNHRLYQCQATGMQCNICKKEFNDRNRLIGHLKGHMVSKDYGCKICGKCYPNPSTFRVHMRTHTGERPFKCQICNKGFVRWAGVVGHMKTHNSNKPYKCETCGKGFKISSNLERHKVLHSGILPYCCSYCGKTFSQSDNLQLHVRTYHTNDRPYLCNECGKRFVSSTRLKRHMWVHTGYKPYRCRYCPKAYSNSNDRKNHEKSHTGGISEADKPHACSTCDMRFLHACRLAKHMKTHERPFPCSECTKTFSSETLLSKHLANKHGAQFLEHLSVPLTVEEVYINYQ
ncbi:hypothetical protein ILUMI_06647 [Ignelater luminosus]|uniref:Uncharacterized protein n=1 Tax=Ignelater luminosus TaxID=2038154 RepID=A0A8K0D8V1_IGNLU|nr:hypothetical protein ILUMI_06647 [Ignelater luminosus]